MNARKAAPYTIYRELASAIGAVSARLLVDKMGGMRIYVPRSIAPEHDIAKSIGLEAAAQLANFFHGTWISLPMPRTLEQGPRRVRELARDDPDLTRSRIAGETGYSERQVYRILDPKARDTRQGGLFGDDD